MTGRWLLDTNVIIALFGDETEVKEFLSAAEEVFIPSIAIGELYYGARKSAKPTWNSARIDEFTAEALVLACDVETAKQYGAVKNDLRIKGQPIPENDIWIAAIALQHDLTLATRDGHFREISGLRLAAW
jgi:tRNA(fMet)-specific endonuclease VapC